ncbi:Ig-like domain-containing protein [Flavobacterium suzhouense]|uniref:T9SS type A sorting domain-containing protein n=1 Tax=Flavobacterium suzhouense TaxID=1529638 RepID=A0ABW5NQQ4_9FLAO
MTRKLPNLILGLMTLFAVGTTTAQEYQTMPIASGLNADVIANGVGSALSSTSIDIDGVNYNYVATDFKATASSTAITYGVPANGLINSIVTATPGLSYQLAPLSGNNSLRLATGTTSGTIAFTTPMAVNTLYMLGVTGSGSGTVTAVVNFSDATSQTFTSVSVPDWYDATNPPPAIQGIGRINRQTNGLESSTTNPRMYQITLAISPANQSKLVQSVTVTKTSTGGEVVNIFAFSADVYTSCPSPTNLTYASTTDGAVINWTAPASAPSSGYEYYTSASATPPTASTTPTGSVAAGVTTKTLTGFAIGSSYYFWIRSNCGATKGFWKQIVFTPGQIVLTYTAGDLNSEYNTAPTLTTVPTCPANLTATIPPGFKIASVATSYNYTSQGGLFMSEQRSILACTTNNTTEASIATSTGNGGTAIYNRTGISIANDLEGTVAFQLRVWRVWGGSGCNVTYGKIDNNTWKVTINLAYATCTTPATPTAANQNICPQATMGDLTVGGISGAVYKFYTAPTGGTAIASTAAVSNGTFYVSQTIGTCESARSAAFTVTLAPTALPTAAPQTLCGGSTVANLTTTSGVNIKWYTAETGGTALAATTALATGNYYVSQTVGGCESARATVAISVTTIAPPTVAAQTFCAGSGATVANLVATGEANGTIKWYASETATVTLAPTTVLGTGTYYVSQTVGVCESIKVSCQVTIASVVSPVIPAQQLCSGATVANLPTNPNISITYKWYATSTSTTPLTSDTVLATGTYYVTQTIAVCESAKSTVQVTINTVTPPVVEDQEFCAGATVADLQATPAAGNTIKWYASETSTTALTATTALATGTYYVSQSINGCESSKDAVAVVVFDAVAAPVTAPQLICFGSTLADVPVTAEEGATLTWYASATATASLDASTPVITGTTYYVSQTVGNCEGARASITVTLNSIAAPAAQNFAICNSSLFAELPVEGLPDATFNWYSSQTSTVQLVGLVSAGTFYVSQTVDGCESPRTAATIALTNVPTPFPAAEQTFCGEAFVADLEAGATAGYTVNWYSPTGDPVTPNDVLVSGQYTVTQTMGECESIAATVDVVVTTMPDAPVGPADQDYENGQTAGDLEVEFIAGATVQWYFLDEDVWIEIPATTPLIDGAVYGVTQTVGDCESEVLAITVNIVLGADDFALANLVIYPNPSSDIMNIEGRENITELSVYNLLGQKVLYQKVNATSTQINISSLPSATYLLMATGANGGTATFKIVKQ